MRYPASTMNRGSRNPAPPSKVLFINSHDADEPTIQSTLTQFGEGRPLAIFMMESKGQCFVEFPSIMHASQALEYIITGGLETHGGKILTAQFSNRQEVTPATQTNRKRPMDQQQPSINSDYANYSPSKRPMFNRDSERQMIPPSPVLCVKTDITEMELLDFLMPTGFRPVDTLLLSNKNTIFVQYSTIDESTAVLNFIQEAGFLSVNGYHMDVAYSTRQCIEKKNRPDYSVDQIGVEHSDNPTKVILISLRAVTPTVTPTVDNVMVPFSRCGIVERIVVFSKKPDHCQALVQYASAEFAQLAVEKYTGTTLGSYQLHVKFSDRSEIDVQRNCDRSRDFTNPWLSEWQD